MSLISCQDVWGGRQIWPEWPYFSVLRHLHTSLALILCLTVEPRWPEENVRQQRNYKVVYLRKPNIIQYNSKDMYMYTFDISPGCFPISA